MVLRKHLKKVMMKIMMYGFQENNNLIIPNSNINQLQTMDLIIIHNRKKRELMKMRKMINLMIQKSILT